jgi:hypothetical protein
MPRGLNRNGDYRRGNPVTLPKDFGNKIDWTPSPAEFGNPVDHAADPTQFGNPVTWTPSPAHFGNSVGGTPVTPTFDPPAGTYGVPQVVHIISPGNDAIYFTTDGSTPTTASRLYTGSVFVPSTETLQAIAVIDGVSSAVGSAAYVIGSVALPSLVNSGVAGLMGSTTPTPLTMNTTGATLLVAVITTDTAPGTISDSLGNTWNYISGSTSSGTGITRMAYAFAHSGGALSTGVDVFTTAGAFAVAVVYAFKGTKTTSAVYAGNTVNAAPQTPTSPFFGGSITPAKANNVLVFGCGGDSAPITAATISSTAPDTFTTPLFFSGSSNDSPVGSVIVNASGAAVNPQWTLTGPTVSQQFTSISAEFVSA